MPTGERFENPGLEPGELFDCRIPGRKHVYRFERVRRPRCEDIYLLSLSGIIVLKKLEAHTGGKVQLVWKEYPGAQQKERRKTIAIDEPGVTFLGRMVSILIRYNSSRDKYVITKHGRKAGYGPSNDPFDCWT